MKVLTKITDTISKVAEWIIMAMILGLVGLIVTELCRRNFLNQSWLPTTELCGILFLWMAFIGIIPLYNKSGLIRLDFLVTRLHGIAAEIVWYITDLVGLGLGVVMIMAFNAQYRFVASRTYATMPNVHYTIQYIPMAIAGVFIALKSFEMLVGHIASLPACPALLLPTLAVWALSRSRPCVTTATTMISPLPLLLPPRSSAPSSRPRSR